MYLYIKALHIIFIVTWFAGLFYIVRLFVYHTEAQSAEEPRRSILQEQFKIMMKRLWYGITWPSAVLTLIFGPWMVILLGDIPGWLWVKLVFVLGLYSYHFILHGIFKGLMKDQFRYTSTQLRIWNEVATIFLVAIVFLVVLKSLLSMAWALIGLVAFTGVLLLAIRLYKKAREKRSS
ncbi:CopD family protein [Chitinophaga niabensis]|uniref:Protoporphyrinogen IX oxidase n=1 Tax=Chitinophaga niabensis TaxID=536979 RepID=A0A1N6JNN5_9BACT|nr:CopD family protein [Chitinophaga niabensis]SIO45853.1 putative membrane protein [Chitinophaga niabensis]